MVRKTDIWTNDSGATFWREGCNRLVHGKWQLNLRERWFRDNGYTQVAEIEVPASELPSMIDGVAFVEEFGETCYIHYIVEPDFSE